MRILVPGANCMGIYQAKETGVLVDASDYYRAFHQTASQARQYILLAGWQFDSDVRLLRGVDNPQGAGEVRFIKFLEALCEKTPELEIYLLAWDFSSVFALEREWFQDLIFNWAAHERIHFRFDSAHAAGATHHQKFVIIDGKIAFVGGMDICSSRWDDRFHQEANPDRVDVNGSPYGSYHDIQSYHTGPIVKELLDLFAERWADSGGKGLIIPTADLPISLDTTHAFPMPAAQVAVSRTRARNPQTERGEIFEIRRLFIDAIMSAEKVIYLENQYFSSQAIYWSLIARMAMAGRPRLQIVMMLPDRLPLTEEVFLGLPQVKMIRSLQEVAEKTGHVFSVYSSTALIDDGTRKMTFIHSKLLLVDDRFLTIGSANATNRSMGLDTELNVSWEADPASEPELAAAIRELRCSLLAEHAGLLGTGEEDRFQQIEDLTTRLDSLADDHRARLCRYTPDPALVNSDWPETLEPVAKIVDPDHPVDAEFFFEVLSKYETSAFARGILKLSQMIIGI
ncbi:MAG TPA: phospholipase D-like domain-containing protein [Geomonas sp.]|nr:phospholipase D-like domain-containing protein [Geomonas sp.]